MFLLKALFKIVFKWLFVLFTSMGGTDGPLSNGHQRNSSSRTEPRRETTDILADRAISQLREAVAEVEDTLDRRIEKMYGPPAENPEVTDMADVNDLRAELAELKADIRSLKRMIAIHSDSHDDPSHR